MMSWPVSLWAWWMPGLHWNCSVEIRVFGLSTIDGALRDLALLWAVHCLNKQAKCFMQYSICRSMWISALSPGHWYYVTLRQVNRQSNNSIGLKYWLLLETKRTQKHWVLSFSKPNRMYTGWNSMNLKKIFRNAVALSISESKDAKQISWKYYCLAQVENRFQRHTHTYTQGKYTLVQPRVWMTV